VNTALNKFVPKLGLDGLLIPVDAAISGLLACLDASLVPSLLAALQPL
jgi:N-acetylmuramic acid 6-phosphate (MurNAc-6-P) etherase